MLAPTMGGLQRALLRSTRLQGCLKRCKIHIQRLYFDTSFYIFHDRQTQSVAIWLIYLMCSNCLLKKFETSVEFRDHNLELKTKSTSIGHMTIYNTYFIKCNSSAWPLGKVLFYCLWHVSCWIPWELAILTFPIHCQCSCALWVLFVRSLH